MNSRRARFSLLCGALVLALGCGHALAQQVWREDWEAQREQLAKNGVAYQPTTRAL